MEKTVILRVQYYETDAMGVVHHSNYLRFFETARTEGIRDAGYSYEKMEEEGILIPVTEVSVKYMTPAVYDEVIAVSCWMEKLGGASFVLAYEVRNAEDGTLHATGRSRHGVTDKQMKPYPIKKQRPDIYKVFQSLMRHKEEPWQGQ